MKALFEHIETGIESSVKVKTYAQKLIDVPMHYHPEHEIVYIQKGHGHLFLADVEAAFGSGDLFYIRGSIPHLFEDAAIRTGKNISSAVTVIQYAQSLFEHMYSLPEFAGIRHLESLPGYGIKIEATARLKKMIAGLEQRTGLLQLNGLIELLHEIITVGRHSYLGFAGKNINHDHVANLRLQKLHRFLSEYFYRDISVDEVAALLHMSKTSFCRFLKRETGKTFSTYLNYYRIQHACSLLRHSQESVMQVCYSCGFNNAAYFFRQFKKQRGMAPAAYRKVNATPSTP